GLRACRRREQPRRGGGFQPGSDGVRDAGGACGVWGGSWGGPGPAMGWAMSTDGFDGLLDQCLGVRPGEQVVLLTDGGTDDGVVSRLLEALAARYGIPLVARMPAPHLPGAEPPGAVAAMMLAAGAVIELTSLFIG